MNKVLTFKEYLSGFKNFRIPEASPTQAPTRPPKPGHKWNWTGKSWDQVRIDPKQGKGKGDMKGQGKGPIGEPKGEEDYVIINN